VSVKHSNQDGVLYDAIADKAFCGETLQLISARRRWYGNRGELTANHTAILRILRRETGLNLEPSVSKAEQTNSSVIYGDRLHLKFLRRLDPGLNPDLEIAHFLTARKFPHSPPLAGALEYTTGRDEPVTVAILTSFVPECKNAWEYTLDVLGRFYERIQTLPARSEHAPVLPAYSAVKLASIEIIQDANDMIGSYLQDARLMGQRTATLHLALSSETDDPSFRPEPWTPYSQRGVFQSLRNLIRQNFQLLGQVMKGLAPEVQAKSQQVLALESAMLQKLRQLWEGRIDAVRIRNHGDYHLGQLLHTGKDFLIINFEGDSSIALSERRLKRSPLNDVAGMFLSFRYAAAAALLKQTEHGPIQEGQAKAAVSWERYWSAWASVAFLRAYLESSQGAPYLPTDEGALRIVLEASVLRNAVYKLGHELRHRPEWAKIPLQVILDLMSTVGNTKAT
jgi:maltose alpha-D-glucosyltransferase/alpha-amylase